ncbi:MAG: ABC transporter substrate-binding protein [Candidatus Electrothrix scaldis]|nr:MAG: ABC transporter substrate-binding protein [Candidatus Electrothrix sp. GW3-3]
MFKGICFLLFFIGLTWLAWPLISGGPVLPVNSSNSGNKLVVGKPFGPSAVVPDPAKGYNGWYLSEAGVTETLFSLDFGLHLQPLLAASSRHLDPLSWEISLKKDILFHDHTPLNAEAVKWSLERIINPDSEVFNKRLQGLLDISSITVQDEQTLLFRTNSPNAAFLYNLTAPGTAILSPASNTKRFFGTGPFVLEKTVPNQEMRVRAFTDYWQGKPGFEQVSLKMITNPATRMLAFEAGQLDVAAYFPEQDALRLQSRDDVQIVQQPTTRLCFLFVRVSDGPLADPLIRQALNYALDREEIVQAVLAGQGGTVAASVFPAILPWANLDLPPYPYDAPKAAQLLSQAGLQDTNGDGMLEKDGRPLLLNIWTYEGRAALKPALELIQAQLKRVGIASQTRITKKGSPINQAMQRGQVQLGLQMWNTAPQGDPDFFLSQVFTSQGGSNFMGYQNAELDELVRQGKTTFDPAARKKIYDRVQEIISQDSPVIPLFHQAMISAVRGDIEQFRSHPAEKYLLTHRLRRKE